MWPDRVSNPGPLTYESVALLTALCGPAEQDVKSHVIHPLLLMVEEDMYFAAQLSPLEGYPLTFCDVTSHIKVDRLSIDVKCLNWDTSHSVFCFGVARNRFE